MAGIAKVMIGALVAAAVCFSCCTGVNHDIGAWTLGREREYKQFAESTVFHQQDTIQFRYTAGVHNVWELGSQEDFDSCNLGDPVSMFNEGDVTITLSKLGKHYYVCGVGLHCAQGMRVVIDVVPSDAPVPVSAPLPAEVPSSPAVFPFPDVPAPAPSSDYESNHAEESWSPVSPPLPAAVPSSPAVLPFPFPDVPAPAPSGYFESNQAEKSWSPFPAPLPVEVPSSPAVLPFPFPGVPTPAPSGYYESNQAEESWSPAASPSKDWSFDDDEQYWKERDPVAAPTPGGDGY